MITIVAAGGSGTRMAPSTKFINKHLMSVGYGELMIDMPLTFLANHGLTEICMVTGSNHATQLCEYVGDGEKYGFSRVDYYFQPKPLGIADVLNRVSHQNVDDGVMILLGDNYFEKIQPVTFNPEYAAVFEYDLQDINKAKAFGQIVYDDSEKPIGIVEKPKIPMHSRILTGLYFFPGSVFNVVKCLEPSQRGELEITDLIKTYLERDRLQVFQVQGKWADLGEHHSWAQFVSERSKEYGSD